MLQITAACSSNSRSFHSSRRMEASDKKRATGTTSGTVDKYYQSPTGKRFRSLAEMHKELASQRGPLTVLALKQVRHLSSTKIMLSISDTIMLEIDCSTF